MKPTTVNFIVSAALAAALIAAGIIAYRAYTVFPLTTLLEEDEIVSPGMSVTLDDQIVGRVGRIDSSGKNRSAEIRIEKREVFGRLQVGLVRITGGDELKLATSLCSPGSPRLERGAIVPSVSPSEFFFRRYVNPSRWSTWVWVGAAVVALGWIFRRPLGRLTT
jgi:hypothetical protein